MTKDDSPGKSSPDNTSLFKDAYFQALEESPYTAKYISERSNIPGSAISAAKVGRQDCGLSRFQRLVNALPEETADRFYEILLQNRRVPRRTPLETAVRILPKLSDEELMELSAAIAEQALERNCDGQAHFSMALKLITYLQMDWMPELLNKISDRIKYLGGLAGGVRK